MAYIYVRQSTLHQVQGHRETMRRQYNLVEPEHRLVPRTLEAAWNATPPPQLRIE